MQNIIIYTVIILVFLIFYKLYQFIDPYGERLVLTISYRRGDLKGSVKGWVFLFLITSMALSFYIWLKVFYKISLIGKDDIGDYIYVFLHNRKFLSFPLF